MRNMIGGICRTPALAWFFVCLTAPLVSGWSLDKVEIPDASGKPLFELWYLAPDDASTLRPSIKSDWLVDQSGLREGIASGASAWALVLGAGNQNKVPGVVEIFGRGNYNNDAAESDTILLPDGRTGTALQALVAGGYDYNTGVSPGDWMAHAYFYVGDWAHFGGLDFYSDAPVNALPRNGDKLPTSVVFFHEFGHALGIAASSTYEIDEYGDGTSSLQWMFGSEITPFTQGLVDSRGTRAKEGMLVFQTTAAANAAGYRTEAELDSVFITDNNTLSFTGDHLAEVLRGAYDNKAPINGWEGRSIPQPDFSHLEFRNSLMSHQGYRNTGVFFEAELAIMQDIGYTIDRKNFYGFSVYNSGQTIVNSHGFFARNADGTAYQDGVPNPTANAVGLHLFGDDNTVTQAADILTSGFGALGVRVDGQNNHVIVAPTTTILAAGEDAIGVAVAYGKGHALTHRGTITASGARARGVSFDFGSNVLGDGVWYEGSYISTEAEGYDDHGNVTGWKPVSLNPLTDGALVERFDLTGIIMSAGDAIFISEDAHVREINILAGASIVGTIRSEWNPTTDPFDKHYLNIFEREEGDFADYITVLSFGRASDADGNAAAGTDAAFAMRYDGDIVGGTGLALDVAGGSLTYTGDATALSAGIRSGATLAGTGTFTIADISAIDFSGIDYDNDFVNLGTLRPGVGGGLGVMRVVLEEGASFRSEGTIDIAFDSQGEHSVLALSGTGSNAARVAGATRLLAMADYYASGQRIDFENADIFNVSGVDVDLTTAFDAVSFTPTLTMTAMATTDGVRLQASRAEDAYAQFADADATRSIGHELRRISYLDDMPGSYERVLLGLDLAGAYVGAEGVRDGLDQFTPHFANAAATRSLDNQRTLTDALLNRLLPDAREFLSETFGTAGAYGSRPAAPGRDVRVFATAIGGGGSQDDRGGGIPGYSFWSAGALVGMEWVAPGRVLGGHLGYGHWKMDADRDSSRLTANAFSLGGHARFSPAQWNGGYLFGLARGTVERNRMRREVRLYGDSSRNNSKWTGFAGNAVLGGGYDFEFGCFRLGPTAALDYALTHRRSAGETGSFGLLHLDSETYQSFRSSLGLRASGQLGRKTTLALTARWSHEFLDKMGTTRARFDDVGVASWGTRAKFAGRDSLGVTLGLEHAVSERLSFRVDGGGEFFRKGYASGWGSLGMTLAF